MAKHRDELDSIWNRWRKTFKIAPFAISSPREEVRSPLSKPHYWSVYDRFTGWFLGNYGPFQNWFSVRQKASTDYPDMPLSWFTGIPMSDLSNKDINKKKKVTGKKSNGKKSESVKRQYQHRSKRSARRLGKSTD